MTPLSQASLWFRASGFPLNENKTQLFHFPLRDLPFHQNSIKLFGIFVDSKMSWELHINYIKGRLSKVI